MSSKLMQAVVASTALAVIALGGHGAQAATVAANAKARVLAAVTLSQTADLNFGTIVPGTTASTVVVNSGGGSICGAGLSCLIAGAAGGFNVGGTTGETVALTSDATASLSNGTGGTMNVTGLSLSNATLVLAGGDTFTVGGTLNVGAAQAAGSYTGSFNVSANYQ